MFLVYKRKNKPIHLIVNSILMSDVNLLLENSIDHWKDVHQVCTAYSDIQEPINLWPQLSPEDYQGRLKAHSTALEHMDHWIDAPQSVALRGHRMVDPTRSPPSKFNDTFKKMPSRLPWRQNLHLIRHRTKVRDLSPTRELCITQQRTERFYYGE